MVKESRKATKKTIKPGKNIDNSTIQGLREQLLSLINVGVKEIIIDFNRVEEIDSYGLGILIGAYNSLKESEGRLKIKNVSENMNKFFNTIHLDQYFDVMSR